MGDRIPLQYLDNLSKGDFNIDVHSIAIADIADRAERQKTIYQVNAQRLDSIAPNSGFHLARELEFAYQKAIEQKYTELKFLEMIPTDSSVPEGALVYKIEKWDSTGAAQYHRGNSNTKPKVGLSREEEMRPVRHIVTGFELNYFEMKAAGYSGQDLRGKMERTARRVVQEFLHEKTLVGSAADDVFGAITYPYFPKTASTVEIGPNSASTPAEQLAELLRLAKLNFVVTDEKFSPDSLAMPTEQYLHIKETQLSFNGEQKTILEAFKLRSGISQVMSLPHLKELGGSGQDVMFFYRRNNMDAIANVIVKPFTMLPVSESGSFGGLYVPCYMSHGGVRSFEPMHQLICHTPTPS